ncbi:MAG: hypothetical protein AAGG38_14130 [Planctomycetota bacterium]
MRQHKQIIGKADAFITSELWILSWNASVQRARLFDDQATEQSRRAFRKRVIRYLETTVLPRYGNTVSDAEHCGVISRVVEECSKSDESHVLGPDGYRIGIAQKLVNLQLKYLWCLGSIPEPPHCPVDRLILEKTRLRGTIAWTQICSIEVYKQAISALRECADAAKMSLANWELNTYDRNDA